MFFPRFIDFNSFFRATIGKEDVDPNCIVCGKEVESAGRVTSGYTDQFDAEGILQEAPSTAQNMEHNCPDAVVG